MLNTALITTWVYYENVIPMATFGICNIVKLVVFNFNLLKN